MTGESFEKAKKGMKDTAKGVEDTAGGVIETAGGVIEGVEDTAERVIEGVKDTVRGVKEGVEETAEGVKDTAEEVVDPNTYTGSDEEKEINKNREYNEAGGKEPMNPEDIAEHEPTAVKRDKNKGGSGEPV